MVGKQLIIELSLVWFCLVPIEKMLFYPIDEQHELLKRSKAEQESLLQELHNAKQCCEETQVKVILFYTFLSFMFPLLKLKSSSLIQKNCDTITALLEESKEEYAAIIQNKNFKLEELSRVQDQQAEKLEQSQTNIQNLQNLLTLETKR